MTYKEIKHCFEYDTSNGKHNQLTSLAQGQSHTTDNDITGSYDRVANLGVGPAKLTHPEGTGEETHEWGEEKRGGERGTVTGVQTTRINKIENTARHIINKE